MTQVTVKGEQISKDRKQIAYRGIDVFLCNNKDIDWDSCNLLITAVPKSSEKDSQKS